MVIGCTLGFNLYLEFQNQKHPCTTEVNGSLCCSTQGISSYEKREFLKKTLPLVLWIFSAAHRQTVHGDKFFNRSWYKWSETGWADPLPKVSRLPIVRRYKAKMKRGNTNLLCLGVISINTRNLHFFNVTNWVREQQSTEKHSSVGTKHSFGFLIKHQDFWEWF